MAARVTMEDVKHAAQLARLGLSEERARDLMRDLNAILEHMAELSRVDTAGVEEASGIGAAGMRLREDRGPAIPLDEPLAAFAPETRDGLLTVPRLGTHENSQESSA